MNARKVFRLGATARWAVVVSLAFAAIHLPSLHERYTPNTWLFRDNAFYYLTMVTLADHGRLEQRAAQPQSWYDQDLGWNRNLPDDWSNVALSRNGGWYPKHPILLPVLALPFYFVLGTIGTLVLNVLLNLTFILLVFLLARRVARLPVAALAAIAVAAMPFTRDMSYSFSNDLLSAVLILGALEAALSGWLAVAGVLAGFSIWSRVTNVVLLPTFLLAGYEAGGWRAIRRAVLFALIPIGLFGAFNTWLFGAPWITTYQRVIVRENGMMTTASHLHHFNVPFRTGLHELLFGAGGAYPMLWPQATEGVFRTFWLFAPGLAGMIVLLWRKPRYALALLLACLLPMLAYAKYDFFRPHFIYPAFGLSGVGLAALVSLVFPQRGEVSDTPWQLPRWAAWGATGLLLASTLTWRFSHRPDPLRLSSHVREAHVFLDDIPCDYWNIQVARWECSHYDQGAAWAMTGGMLAPVRVRGVPRSGLWMHPSPTTRTKRMVFDSLNARSVDLDFALGDQTRPGTVEVTILARGQAPIALRLTRPGEEQRRTVPIGTGAGPALELRVRSAEPNWKPLIVQGRLHPPR